MGYSRMLVAILIVLSCSTAAWSGEKRSTGHAEGNRFRDASGFTLDKYDNWKFGKIESEDPAKPRLARCIVLQKSVTYPTAYLGNEDKFNMPVIVVFTDTSEMPLDAYVAELSDRKSKRASRKEILKDYAIISEGSFIDQGPITIDGQRAIAMHFRKDYEVQLYNRVKDQYSLKEDALIGDLYVTKRGNAVYLLGLICEREIYRTVNEEAKTIIMSIDFDPPADTTQGAAPGASGQ
jgi:hypothetical protein